ncbi:hypothetical protein KY346_03375 [Candidatus Woesearchaeota archaeon]|nr:hypothetical protein [Candidatus Woesearchaeota archaeon]
MPVFLAVSLVAVVALSLFVSTQYSGGISFGQRMTGYRCVQFAQDFDRVVKNTLFMAQGEERYSRAYEVRENPCTDKTEEGILEAVTQTPPLEGYNRFAWINDVYGYQGGPEPKIGYIQYWLCSDDERARVVISGIEVCNTFDDTYSFEENAGYS